MDGDGVDAEGSRILGGMVGGLCGPLNWAVVSKGATGTIGSNGIVLTCELRREVRRSLRTSAASNCWIDAKLPRRFFGCTRDVWMSIRPSSSSHPIISTPFPTSFSFSPEVCPGIDFMIPSPFR